MLFSSLNWTGVDHVPPSIAEEPQRTWNRHRVIPKNSPRMSVADPSSKRVALTTSSVLETTTGADQVSALDNGYPESERSGKNPLNWNRSPSSAAIIDS